MNQKSAAVKKSLSQVTKKMRADTISLKEKRMLFHDKTKMILEEISTENELKQKKINEKYEEIQSKLKENFEEKTTLESRKEEKIAEEKERIEKLEKREEELKGEIERLKNLLKKAEEELAEVEREKGENQERVKQKERQFVEREAELGRQFGELTLEKEREEARKMKEDKNGDRIGAERAKLEENIKCLDGVIWVSERRVAANLEHFEKVSSLFAEEEKLEKGGEEGKGNIYSNKRSFERKMEALNFEVQTIEDDISLKVEEVQQKKSEVESLKGQINTNDANKKMYIKEKKFSQANMCMKTSKKLAVEKREKEKEIDELEKVLAEQKKKVEAVKAELDEMKEGASEMWLNVKRHALHRLEKGSLLLEAFVQLFESEVFEHLRKGEVSKKVLLDVESEKNQIRDILAEMASRSEKLRNEIKEEDESEFDGDLVVQLFAKVEQFASTSSLIEETQNKIGG